MEIRHGMSGAPIYHRSTQQIVGIISKYTWLKKEKEEKQQERQENVPYATPIEEIAKINSPIKEHLYQQLRLTQLRQFNWSQWFTESLFKRFYEKLPIKILESYEKLENNINHKFLELLEQPQLEGHIDNFIYSLREDCPLIPLGKLIEELSPFDQTNFFDRKNEKETALQRARFFEAPVGYGKTTLLRAIEQQSYKEKWLPISVEVPQKGMNALELACKVAKVVGIAMDLNYSMETMAIKLSGALEQQLKQKSGGIFLLIDNADNLLKEEINKFSGFLENLNNHLAKDYKFKLTLAGRCSGSEWQESFVKRKLPPIEIEPLKPFHLNIIIQEIIKSISSPNSLSDEQLAQFMYETGGHPGCVIQLIKDFLNKRSDSISPCLEEKIKEVNDSIPKSLQNILVNLCVLRRYDSSLLKELQTKHIIEYEDNVFRLEEELGTLSFVRKIPNTGFIEDGVTRSLLAIRLRSEDRKRFINLCLMTKEIYKEYLINYTPPHPHSVEHLIFIEGLYQELQYGYHQGNQDVEARKKLHETFFNNNGTLAEYVKILKSKNGVEKNRIKASIKSALKADEEFQFTLNFFLRDNDYNNEPYELMGKQLEDYFN